jgi:hypothetical protein
MVNPSVFAVFRFITSSYLLGVCTGRSAGYVDRILKGEKPAARRKISDTSLP